MTLHETFTNDFADIPYAIAFLIIFCFCRSLSGLAMVLQSLDVGIAYAVRATNPTFYPYNKIMTPPILKLNCTIFFVHQIHTKINATTGVGGKRNSHCIHCWNDFV
jgi:hypothetical protein